MATSLKAELENVGCDAEPDDFRDNCAEAMHAVAPSCSTVDELLCHPDDAKRVCHVVRGRLKCEGIPDHLICRTLLNMRKGGESKAA